MPRVRNHPKEKIKTEYLAGALAKDLAQKYKVPKPTIDSWVLRERWDKSNHKTNAQHAPRKGLPANMPTVVDEDAPIEEWLVEQAKSKNNLRLAQGALNFAIKKTVKCQRQNFRDLEFAQSQEKRDMGFERGVQLMCHKLSQDLCNLSRRELSNNHSKHSCFYAKGSLQSRQCQRGFWFLQVP